jgi:hypothetical protein
MRPKRLPIGTQEATYTEYGVVKRDQTTLSLHLNGAYERASWHVHRKDPHPEQAEQGRHILLRHLLTQCTPDAPYHYLTTLDRAGHFRLTAFPMVAAVV